MIIATFNVNSVNARIENLREWLKEKAPDIVLMQEIKTEFNTFPFFELQSLGYNVQILGQKSYNGVAIISKHKIVVTEEGLPGFEDENARYIEAVINAEGQDWRVASIYLPNGNPPYNNPDDNSKFDYKLRWMEALYEHAAKLLQKDEVVILGGDYNVILTPEDVYDVKPFINNALYREEVKQRLSALMYLGYYDAYRVKHPKETGYTYWDYGKAFQVDWGMRIDYLMLSPKAADMLQDCYVDKNPRGKDKPSDHTPLIVELKKNEQETY